LVTKSLGPGGIGAGAGAGAAAWVFCWSAAGAWAREQADAASAAVARTAMNRDGRVMRSLPSVRMMPVVRRRTTGDLTRCGAGTIRDPRGRGLPRSAHAVAAERHLEADTRRTRQRREAAR